MLRVHLLLASLLSRLVATSSRGSHVNGALEVANVSFAILIPFCWVYMLSRTVAISPTIGTLYTIVINLVGDVLKFVIIMTTFLISFALAVNKVRIDGEISGDSPTEESLQLVGQFPHQSFLSCSCRPNEPLYVTGGWRARGRDMCSSSLGAYSPLQPAHIALLLSRCSGSWRAAAVTLFWSMFGILEPSHLHTIHSHNNFNSFTAGSIFFFVGVFMVISVIMLLNMLVATLNNRYQRVLQNASMEWNHAFALLVLDHAVRGSDWTGLWPSPLNMVVAPVSHILRACRHVGRQVFPKNRVDGNRVDGNLRARKPLVHETSLHVESSRVAGITSKMVRSHLMQVRNNSSSTAKLTLAELQSAIDRLAREVEENRGGHPAMGESALTNGSPRRGAWGTPLSSGIGRGRRTESYADREGEHTSPPAGGSVQSRVRVPSGDPSSHRSSPGVAWSEPPGSPDFEAEVADLDPADSHNRGSWC